MEGSSACSAGGGRELESGLTGLPAFYHHGPKPGHRPVHRAGWGRGLLSVAGTCRGDAPRLWGRGEDDGPSSAGSFHGGGGFGKVSEAGPGLGVGIHSWLTHG